MNMVRINPAGMKGRNFTAMTRRAALAAAAGSGWAVPLSGRCGAVLGIDVGSAATKGVLLQGGRVAPRCFSPRRGHEGGAEAVIAALLKQAGLPRAAVDRIVVTGYGRTAFPITRRDRDHLP